MQYKENITDKKAEVLLKICSLLMTSGANTSRVLLLLERFSKLMNTDAQVFINHKAFIITLTDEKTQEKTTQLKRLPGHGINFSIMSALSRASMKAKNEAWSFNQIEDEVNRIADLKHYPRIIILLAVSLAGAGFCNLFGGNWLNMIITFFATMGGLFVRQELVKKSFNHYLCALVGAFIASSIAAVALFINANNEPQLAMATSVLFLIPGVPLINSFTDLVDGYIITGTVRFINGLIFVMAIALALFIVMYIFGIHSL